MKNQIGTIQDVIALSKRSPVDISLSEESFGGFRYSPHGLGDRNYPTFTYTTPDRVRVRVGLDMSDTTELSSVTVKLKDGWWHVDRYQVIFKTEDEHSTKFPQVEFRWACSDHSPGRLGKLDTAVYRAEYAREIFYCYEGDGTENIVRGNIKPGELGLPKTLIGASTFKGRALKWELDVRAKEREILAASRIAEFIASVPVRTERELNVPGPKILTGPNNVRVIP